MFKAPAPAPPEPAPKAVKKPAGRPPIPRKKTNYLPWILIAGAVLAGPRAADLFCAQVNILRAANPLQGAFRLI